MLLSTISISSKTSSNSVHVNYFPIVLYKHSLIRQISRSNWPPHHGVLGTLNFPMIVSLLKKSGLFDLCLCLLATLPLLWTFGIITVNYSRFAFYRSQSLNLKTLDEFCGCEIGYYSHGHNILKLFDTLPRIFFSPQVKPSKNISKKHGIYKFPHELPNDLRVRILAN